MMLNSIKVYSSKKDKLEKCSCNFGFQCPGNFSLPGSLVGNAAQERRRKEIKKGDRDQEKRVRAERGRQ